MQNPSEKKPFPWGWVAVGCGAIAIIVLALAVVLIFKALPAVRTALADLNSSLAPTQAPLVIPTLAAPGSPTQVPNSGGGGTRINDLPFKLSAIQDISALSTQSLLDQMTAVLNLNNDTDFMAPKSYKGTATLDPTSDFTVGNAWCAADSSTLKQNLSNMQFQLSINGNTIDLSQYPTLYFSDNSGEACAMTGVSITPDGNLSGSYHMVLVQKYLNALDDGITGSPYPAGDVTFDFSILFKVTPAPGSNT